MGSEVVPSPKRAHLTLDEIGYLSDLGKPCNAAMTMNLDELLAHAPSSSSSSSSTTTVSMPPPAGYDLNFPLSQKAIDEAWREIVRHEEQGSSDGAETFSTLQDILVRAGLRINIGSHNCPGMDVDSSALLSIDPVLKQQEGWLQYQLSANQQQQQNQHMPLLETTGMPMFGNTILNAGLSENQQQISVPMVSVESKPSLSESIITSEKNRADEKTADKSIERRQKRMIKNRESAARSRARKQAYIKNLEDEVRRLTALNKQLEKQVEQKEEDKKLRIDPTPEPRYQLRRISSLPSLSGDL